MRGFGLPDETRISRVHLRTADLDRALEFYAGVLGFHVISQSSSSASLAAAENGPVLVTLTEDKSAGPRLARTTGLYHFAVRYPARSDLANAFRRLERSGHSLEGASDHLVSEALYLSDPDQNGIELYVDRPRSQWIWRDGQVMMSTEPLDLLNLLDTASRGATAPPMSALTDVGHIHLHVADLPTAERFYRDFLGLAVTQRSYPGALFLSAGGYHHHIAVNTWAGRAKAPDNNVGLISYRLEVPLREVIYCLRHRAPLAGYETGTTQLDGSDDCLRIRDPNGNWLEILYAEPSGAGAQRDPGRAKLASECRDFGPPPESAPALRHKPTPRA